MIIAVVNQKGGVGKTTVAVNLAATLAAAGHSTLIVDLDPQANASALLGVRAVDSVFDALVEPDVSLAAISVRVECAGVTLAPGHRALAGLESALRETIGRELLLREALETVAGDYDAVIIDTAPTLGLGTAMALLAADVALVTVQAEPLAIEGLTQIAETIDVVKRRFSPSLRRLIVPTMVDGRTAHGPQIAADLRARMPDETTRCEIPQSADLSRGMLNRDAGGAVINYAPKSKAADAFRALACEVCA